MRMDKRSIVLGVLELCSDYCVVNIKEKAIQIQQKVKNNFRRRLLDA